jgi:hypothetical protein
VEIFLGLGILSLMAAVIVLASLRAATRQEIDNGDEERATRQRLVAPGQGD